MEEFATGSKIKNPKRGENVVGQAEVRAENAADEAAERAPDDQQSTARVLTAPHMSTEEYNPTNGFKK